MNDLFATTAKIGDAQVNTLKIGANAVTVPFTKIFPGETARKGALGVPEFDSCVRNPLIHIEPIFKNAITTGITAFSRSGFLS